MIIEITQQDIDKANYFRYERLIVKSKCCPIVQSLTRKYPLFENIISAGCTSVRIGGFIYEYSQEAQEFVEKYDEQHYKRGQIEEPIHLELLPEKPHQ